MEAPTTYVVNTPRMMVRYLAKLVAHINKLEKRIGQLETDGKAQKKQIAKLKHQHDEYNRLVDEYNSSILPMKETTDE